MLLDNRIKWNCDVAIFNIICIVYLILLRINDYHSSIFLYFFTFEKRDREKKKLD